MFVVAETATKTVWFGFLAQLTQRSLSKRVSLEKRSPSLNTSFARIHDPSVFKPNGFGTRFNLKGVLTIQPKELIPDPENIE